MSANAYQDVPVFTGAVVVSDRDGERRTGTADIVIERNEGSVEIFMKLPLNSDVGALIGAEDYSLEGLHLSALVRPRG